MGPHRRQRHPFFLYLPPSAPHSPHLPPELVRGASAAGPRGDQVALLDWCAGQVAEVLQRGGIADDRRGGGPISANAGQLYDLSRDLAETTNPWHRHPDVVLALTARLAAQRGASRSVVLSD